ncbi:MAG: zinc-dependent metalloprotease [Flavobacteriaceae bacterium]|nr:zinc-dependent metalloprotease [Flavobacteriaceae bacterium]
MSRKIILLAFALLVAVPLKAQVYPLKRKPKTEKKTPKKTDYEKLITKKAVSDKGLFTAHKVEDKYYYEIPDSLLNKEMLMITRVSKTASGIGFGGGQLNEQVLRWQKEGKRMLLRVVSHNVVASDSLPIHEAVVNSNFEPILYSFDIKAKGKDSITSLIEVNKLFEGDISALGFPSYLKKMHKMGGLDRSRSYIKKIKSFPKNIEVRTIKTYYSSKSDIGSFTVEINNSMILLPEKPMKRRYFDERVGWFARSQTDYGLKAQKTQKATYLDRWRLEVKEEDIEKFKRGELVEPKKPIIYYIDRATPKEWAPYIKQGIEDWQKAFEAAGFKNAIIAKTPPTKEEDPDWDADDMRYSVVRYLASPIPNANGPHISDPRTGEILNANINWYHNVMSLIRGWFFAQTAAINPEAQSPNFKKELMGKLIRFVSSHEVGHTLGLPHNMGSSVAYPVDSLRSATFTKKYGTAPSIMDYARFNYIAQPEDKGVSLMPKIGTYDKYAISWGYRPILDKTPTEEKPILNQWILKHAGDPMYRFGHQQMGKIIDPSSQTEDLGDDAMKASAYGIKNLQRIVPNLLEWSKGKDKTYADLKELYGEVLSQFRRYIGHVSTNVGGVYEYYKTYEQAGNVYVPTPKDKQKRAVAFLNKELFTTPTWLINPDILHKIEYSGNIERIKNIQSYGLRKLFDFGRLQRVIENEAINGNKAYTISELMQDLRSGVWKELQKGQKIDAYRRNLQRVYVSELGNLLTKDQKYNSNMGGYIKFTNVDVNHSDIRAIARAELLKIKSMAKNAYRKTTDKMSKYHLKDIEARCEKLLTNKK